MKTLFTAVSLLVLCVCISCNKTSNPDNNTPTITGTWKITLFIESGDASTTDFDGYAFNFASNSVLEVTKSTASVTGSWSQTADKFNINLGAKTDTNKPLGNLTDNWEVISISATEIRLTDSDPTKEELVTFTKN